MRTLLADERSSVRFALRTLLERKPGMQIVGEVASLEALLGRLRAACPDLIVCDWDLLDLVAAHRLAALRSVCPNVAVIVLSGRPEVRQAALTAGADAFVCKTDPPGELLAVIKDRWRRKQVQPERLAEAPGTGWMI
jgi:DNA-binding NarL/FixJ family response regulator